MRAITLIATALVAISAMASGIDFVEQGNKAYDAKHYKKAVEMYERAAKEGVSSQLYYNLGNAYYRLNDRGNAVLSYERALKLDPANGDARYNLTFVKEKAQIVDDNGANFFTSLMGDWVSHASSNTWAVIGFVALLLTLAGIACYRIAGSVAMQKVGFFGAIAMAVITAIATASSIYMYHRCTGNNYAIIMTDKAPVGKAPRTGDKDIAFRLPEGAKVEIVDSVVGKQYGQGNGWYKIETTDGRSGWVTKHSKDIETI